MYRSGYPLNTRFNTKEFMAQTKEETAVYMKQWRAANADKIAQTNKEWRTANASKLKTYEAARQRDPVKVKATRDAYKQANRKRLATEQRAYNIAKPEVAAAYKTKNAEKLAAAARQRAAEYRVKSPTKAKTAQVISTRKRRARDPLFRFSMGLRCAVHSAIKRGKDTKRAKATQYLGCSILEVRAHIESLFQPGMTWDNWAKDGWHIDHKRPVASFDHTDPNWAFVCNHYTNLQPLWAADNFAKNAKWDPTPTAVCA